MAKPFSRVCIADGCANQANKNKRYCSQCRNQREKQINPIGLAYRKLKSNAKRRGHLFDLTLSQFSAFCVETDILLGRGRTATSYHVDRIIEEKGYTAGNLQPLTNSDNVKKENERRRKRKIYDYELAHRKKIGALQSEAEAAISEFRFVDDTPKSDMQPDEVAPF